MFASLWARLGSTLKTKVGIALIGALVVGGGGTALAMTTAHQQLPVFSAFSHASSTAHTGSDDASKTPNASQDDQDDQQCTPRASTSPTTHADEGSDHESDHKSGTPSATKTVGQGDDETNEHESGQNDQDEAACGKSTATHTPEPTERPESTNTPGPRPTQGTGGD
jgi:hypothetical protein